MLFNSSANSDSFNQTSGLQLEQTALIGSGRPIISAVGSSLSFETICSVSSPPDLRKIVSRRIGLFSESSSCPNAVATQQKMMRQLADQPIHSKLAGLKTGTLTARQTNVSLCLVHISVNVPFRLSYFPLWVFRRRVSCFATAYPCPKSVKTRWRNSFNAWPPAYVPPELNIRSILKAREQKQVSTGYRLKAAESCQ